MVGIDICDLKKFYLTVDDICASDKMHCNRYFPSRARYYFQAMIPMPEIGYFVKRYETKKKSHLQANKIVSSDKPYNGFQ